MAYFGDEARQLRRYFPEQRRNGRKMFHFKLEFAYAVNAISMIIHREGYVLIACRNHDAMHHEVPVIRV